ncbi:MAG TPA: protease modulator HflC [Gammaproteobacteria bacterium]|nr:protease modulator HflC [Gammaproteobacteria bacterium]
MSGGKIATLVLTVLVLLAASMSVFIVREGQQAVLFRFGQVVKTNYKPGIYFKVPIANKVRIFDKRILTLDNPPERFLTVEKKNLMVDFFVKWRITDPAQYYRATGGNRRNASQRLLEIIKNGLRAQFAERTVKQVVTAERSDIMGAVTKQANKAVEDFGVHVVDVRIKRINLPDAVSGSVYQRMRSERERTAKQLRAEGSEKAEQIKARADRKRTEILAEAYRESQQIRGAGDARAARIYAHAYRKDPSFFTFYRTMEAYRKSIGGKGDLMALQPDSDFLKYLQSPRPAK